MVINPSVTITKPVIGTKIPKSPKSTSTSQTNHLFFTCGKTMPIWWEYLSWVKEDKVFHCRPLDNFIQHFSSATSKVSNTRRTMWWIAATVSIWRLRNDIIFQNQTFDINRLTDSTLFLLWTWLRGWERNFQIPYYSWSSNMSIAFS